MQVFKFGGASIKDATAVKNMASILAEKATEKTVVIVSAMGKTTNALEQILADFSEQKDPKQRITQLITTHTIICESLFPADHFIFNFLKEQQIEIAAILEAFKQKSTAFVYDQLISKGELISSNILFQYLQQEGFSISFLDARKTIKTDNSYREGSVNWELTKQNISTDCSKLFQESHLIISQGFIGSNTEGFTTTLGREGSDFSAAIFATCLNTANVTIWKDVPGILNADPKRIEEASKYNELSYQEASEMTYYGASVIHPKTIKPLANLGIPLYVKSFQQPEDNGTIIHKCSIKHLEPAIIFKKEQCLVSFQVTDFTFINEENLSRIFSVMAKYQIKMNMMQNSAISFSVCVDNQDYKLKPFLEELKSEFSVRYNTGLELITVKNYTNEWIEKLTMGKEIYLEQRTRKNFQVVVKK